MKHRFLAILIILLLLLTGCRQVSPVSLPARTPVPTETPVPTATPELTPTPVPTPTPIPVPNTLEELSEIVGVDLYAPSDPITGMSFASIGYDGEGSAAMKFTNREGALLLYTVNKGVLAPDFTDCFRITVNGIEISLIADETEPDVFRRAYWIKNGNTYNLYAQPSLSEEDLHSAVSAMILAPQNAKAASAEVESTEELSKAVGFPVNPPATLPKGYSPAHLYALYGQIPVQIYSDESTEITFLKCEGNLLPPRLSKIEYAPGGEYALPNGSVAYLYYTENGISLAEWTCGGYGYSIAVSDTDGNPMDIKKKTFLTLIDGFFEGTVEETQE